MSEVLLSHQEDHVLYLTLNRPDKFNAVNQQLAYELQTALAQAEENDDIRAIYITGEGKAFCAGQDLGEVVDPNGPELKDIVAKHYNPIVEKIRSIEKPIIAAVNGVAAGAGANIALACDIVIADEQASFIQAFSKIGLIPDSGGTWTLPRLIGFQRASALMMLGDKISAQEAQSMGMIYKCVTSDEFKEFSHKIAIKLANMPTKGLGLTKRALNESFSNNMSEQLALEGVLQTEAGTTYDYNEGVAAFLEKRKPAFKGK